ncbi:SDR family oxidoreductase [Metabacillus halosaccharovorans]|uniref:SDR family NAD(P)-dependent oxidoreductase n=1 Tax=Metabacillus halosaccharovorans TaxID=930124 RepID=UPI0020419DCD|nr:SDR family oxidoreductase [Metabacillus halosaccharovorans]MCM3439832.1 SDR family oxidoreductase [Metabacillus halosaccharovorans]
MKNFHNHKAKKSVIVTGISGGIAQPLIFNLKQDGYNIIGLDINDYEGETIDFHRIDLSNKESIIKVLEEVNCLNKVEGVIHLGGIYPNKKIEEYGSDLWEKVFSINVSSIFYLIQGLLEKAENLKSIILVSSTASVIGSKDPAYTASKAALTGLSKSLSLSLADRNIRVNTVLPGIIDTKMSKVQSEQRRNYHISNTLSKRIGHPEDVANMISFLLSPKSSYVWGAQIEINGGMTV